MDLLKQFEFKKIEMLQPLLRCNCCGKSTSRSWLIATISPFIIPGYHFDIVVCGDTCRSNFLKHPAAENFIIDKILDISNQHSISIKPEYKNYFSFAYNSKN